MAPSPIGYRFNLGLRSTSKGPMTGGPLDARSAARLVAVKTGTTIGWTYLDGAGDLYVVLKPNTSERIYKWFAMDQHNYRRPDLTTSPVLQNTPFRVPDGVEIESCNNK